MAKPDALPAELDTQRLGDQTSTTATALTDAQDALSVAEAAVPKVRAQHALGNATDPDVAAALETRDDAQAQVKALTEALAGLEDHAPAIAREQAHQRRLAAQRAVTQFGKQIVDVHAPAVLGAVENLRTALGDLYTDFATLPVETYHLAGRPRSDHDRVFTQWLNQVFRALGNHQAPRGNSFAKPVDYPAYLSGVADKLKLTMRGNEERTAMRRAASIRIVNERRRAGIGVARQAQAQTQQVAS